MATRLALCDPLPLSDTGISLDDCIVRSSLSPQVEPAEWASVTGVSPPDWHPVPACPGEPAVGGGRMSDSLGRFFIVCPEARA
ncbi:unnamed protein product [Boreogadus saida]